MIYIRKFINFKHYRDNLACFIFWDLKFYELNLLGQLELMIAKANAATPMDTVSKIAI